jgi:hypothetical protein
MVGTGGVVQQGGGSTSVDVSEERTALEGLLEIGRFYPSNERCTGVTWKYQVDQLMGINPPITRVAGKMVINVGIGGDTPTKVGKPRTSNFDLIIADVLLEAGSLSTPELHEEILLLGEPITMESLFRLCKKMEIKGQLVSSKQARVNGNGRGVNVWQLVKK